MSQLKNPLTLKSRLCNSGHDKVFQLREMSLVSFVIVVIYVPRAVPIQNTSLFDLDLSEQSQK